MTSLELLARLESILETVSELTRSKPLERKTQELFAELRARVEEYERMHSFHNQQIGVRDRRITDLTRALNTALSEGSLYTTRHKVLLALGLPSLVAKDLMKRYGMSLSLVLAELRSWASTEVAAATRANFLAWDRAYNEGQGTQSLEAFEDIEPHIERFLESTGGVV
jgi:hypothetical protein